MSKAEQQYKGNTQPRVIDNGDGTHTPRVVIGTAIDKFRDPFTSEDLTKWDKVLGNGDIIRVLGNIGGASYLSIIKSIFNQATETSYTSKATFSFPMRMAAGLSLSQRILGQEHAFEMISTDGTDTVEANTAPTALAISGSVTVATNVWTINFATAHGLQARDRVVLYGNAYSPLNVGPVTVTSVVTPTQITITSTLANGTYTAGGFVVKADPLGRGVDAVGYLFDGNSATQANYVLRDNTLSSYAVNAITLSTTTATQVETGNYAESFIPASIYEHLLSMDGVATRSFPADSAAAITHYTKRSQQVPDITKEYKMRFRSRNLENLSTPVGKITAISKTGTTTATVTCANHGLTVNDFVQIYGVRDITNFPNLTAATAVASVVDANTFTIVIGAAVTASSAGGFVNRVNGGTLIPAINFSIQSVQVTSGELTVTLNTTASGALVGEWFTLYGLDGTGAPYEGTYKVIKVTGSTIVFTTTAADIGLQNCGGGVVKNTEFRLHFARSFDFKRVTAEIYGGTRQTDQNNAVSVTVENTASVSGTVTANQGTGVNTGIINSAGWGGFMVNDIASAALTTTTTTAAITPGSVANVGTYAHSFNIIVTAVSGTSPTLDVGIEESVDNGTTWTRIYDFERITANGTYQTPAIRAMAGTRYRYVQTVGGTTPSFTRSLNRVQFSHNGLLLKRFIDRTIAIDTLNSTTPTYNVEGCNQVMAAVRIGTTTVAPVITLEGSEDGTNWFSLATAVTTVASSTITAVSNTGLLPKFARVRTSTAGSGSTLGEVVIKAVGN